jgi:hypothetical protein
MYSYLLLATGCAALIAPQPVKRVSKVSATLGDIPGASIECSRPASHHV